MKVDELDKPHNEQIKSSRGSREIFTLWLVLMFSAVLASHFIINLAAPSITGYSIASGSSLLNDISSLLGALSVLAFAAFVGGLAYIGITKHID